MRRRFEVLGVAQYGRPPGRRLRWRRIGTAFENEDGSINVLIDFIPTGVVTVLVLREAPCKVH